MIGNVARTVCAGVALHRRGLPARGQPCGEGNEEETPPARAHLDQGISGDVTAVAATPCDWRDPDTAS